MIFTQKKYQILLAIVGVLLVGFALMGGGGPENTSEFNEGIFSFRRITLAPILIIGSYAALVWLIFRKTAN